MMINVSFPTCAKKILVSFTHKQIDIFFEGRGGTKLRSTVNNIFWSENVEEMCIFIFSRTIDWKQS